MLGMYFINEITIFSPVKLLFVFSFSLFVGEGTNKLQVALRCPEDIFSGGHKVFFIDCL